MLNLEDLLLVLHTIILFLQILKIRFCIQANRDVTRMEIFVSLVHLLEQTIKNNAVAPGNGIENGNMMVHQSFHQGTSIPATGQPCGLQWTTAILACGRVESKPCFGLPWLTRSWTHSRCFSWDLWLTSFWSGRDCLLFPEKGAWMY